MKWGNNCGAYKLSLPLVLFVIFVVVRKLLIGSDVLMQCPPLRRASRIQSVAESIHARQINNISQITPEAIP